MFTDLKGKENCKYINKKRLFLHYRGKRSKFFQRSFWNRDGIKTDRELVSRFRIMETFLLSHSLTLGRTRGRRVDATPPP